MTDFALGGDAPASNPRDIGDVYFLGLYQTWGDRALALIKIGSSKKLHSRINTIKSCLGPFKGELLAVTTGGLNQERAYQKRFADHCDGGEWFTPAPDILAEIERLNTGANQ